MSRSLNMFILDEMIEQYNRFNPLPDVNKRLTFEQENESELLAGLLGELKILRSRCAVYECQIARMEKELREASNGQKGDE